MPQPFPFLDLDVPQATVDGPAREHTLVSEASEPRRAHRSQTPFTGRARRNMRCLHRLFDQAQSEGRRQAHPGVLAQGRGAYEGAVLSASQF